MKTIAIIGLGNRGTGYMRWIKRFHSSEAKINAVCDIRPEALEDIAPLYKIPPEMRFASYKDMFCNGPIADALMITTQDSSHYEIAKAAIKAGYKFILMEKPVSGNIDECTDLRDDAHANGVVIVVCHVLRYSYYFSKIKEILQSGAIGDIIAINHTENVAYFHFAHSYVRGDWKSEEASTPSILAKCCHDLDLISWYAESECVEVDSTGKVYYFNRAHAPAGAAERCLSDCPASGTCPYNAEKLYITDPFWKAKFIKYMRRKLTGRTKSKKADVYESLRTGDYGKCVFLSDNDVCDFQTVHMRFKNGIDATLTMNAFSDKMFRECHIVGTKGELIGYNHSLKLCVFGSSPQKVHIKGLKVGGHVEGDIKLIDSFIKLIYGKLPSLDGITTIDATIPSHAIAAEAEKKRKERNAVCDSH